MFSKDKQAYPCHHCGMLLFCLSYLLIFWGVFLSCMSVYHVCASCPWRLEQGLRSLRTDIVGDYEVSYGCWEVNPDPLNSVGLEFAIIKKVNIIILFSCALLQYHMAIRKWAVSLWPGLAGDCIMYGIPVPVVLILCWCRLMRQKVIRSSLSARLCR